MALSRIRCIALLLTLAGAAFALPRKNLSQYGHRVWTQAQGLPQDTVRAITQTTDGYLWIGTDEGLARFDGYRFVSFGKGPNELPDAAITALAPGPDGSVWIATAGAVSLFQRGVFRTWGSEAGLDREALISDIRQAPDGALWIAAGLHLFCLRNGQFTRYKAAPGSAIQGIRVVLPEADGTVWTAGYGFVARLEGNQLVRAFPEAPLQGNIAMSIARNRTGQLLLSGTEGIFEISRHGVKRYTIADGLPETFVRSIHEDRDGNIWAGTNSGLARLDGTRFVQLSHETLRAHEWVWAIFEDRDGSLWIGANSGLHQLLNQPIAVMTESDGLPSDQPTAVHQDRHGRIWVGFHDRGAGYLDADGRFIALRGLPSQEVFAIRETPRGDLLISTRGGLCRVHGDRVAIEFLPGDALQRRNVFDAIEDRRGRVWMATNTGVWIRPSPGAQPQSVTPGGGVLLSDAAVTLLETRDGSVWAGVYGRGLWQIRPDGSQRQFTREHGLPGDGVRTLFEDEDGSLWIGTFGGGVARLRNDRFQRFDASAGLPSDIVGRILSSGPDLWFATARGLARVSHQELEQYWSGQGPPTVLTFNVSEGLRSIQCVPGYPTGTGGTRTADGRLWFPTGYGIAIFDPAQDAPRRRPPATRLVELLVDGKPLTLGEAAAEIPADARRVEIRFAAVELTAPETLFYRYRLDGVDRDWVQVSNRRSTEYNNLPYGDYTFRVAASLSPAADAGAPAVLTLHRLPHWWEWLWVRIAAVLVVAAAIWAAWQLRLRQINHSFALVLDERSRIAREIHDTLAQGFVGIGSQLDAVALELHKQPDAAAKHLELARRMSKHSLTEARRSIFDLREANAADLPSSLRSAVSFVTAGRNVKTEFHLDPLPPPALPGETVQQLVRIVQEAAANAAKHASPSTIAIRLQHRPDALEVEVQDDGSGFDAGEALSATGGHFGLLGMQERAERIGGNFELQTAPGRGTTIRVTVPA